MEKYLLRKSSPSYRIELSAHTKTHTFIIIM